MPLFPAKSTAVSDLVLGCSCIWALYSLHAGTPAINLKTRIHSDGGMASNNLASVWFALTLAASTLGAFRFMKREFFDRLAPFHDLLSWLVLVIGLPCLASQFYLDAGLPIIGNLHLLLILPPVLSWLGKDHLLGTFISRAETNKVTGYIALACMFSMTGCAVYSRNYYQLLACLLMFSSSRAFDITENKRLGLPPVDWLHYGLAASNFLLVAGLCHSDLPGMGKLRHWTENAMSSMFS
ncbi:uncharacterized protein LOC124312170 isoform X1 [Daphnia pulicaria]|uniref:uncharacterized protein LOC124312170 isoform X1 n=1 Tax=Daphnia pulicaria TaxID=35523 RepID=UPI001EEAF2C6|nr:uncharacterized protein LOC124312170 isoform X1 [Daphnia pulicaria]